MHRSGTSYLASALRDAGLFLGERLLTGGPGNVNGYFENSDFVRLHAGILEENGLSRFGWTLEPSCPVSEKFRKEAEKLVGESARDCPWGWKDPRTTLFLDFWAELVPKARFLFVYRSPWEVMDSLFRRGDRIFREDPKLTIRLWDHYNRLVLDFQKRCPERCLLVDVRFAMRNLSGVIDALRERLDISLTAPERSLFDQSMFKSDSKVLHRILLLMEFFPDAIELWRELNRGADLRVDAGEFSFCGARHSNETIVNCMLQDWIALGDQQRELDEAERRWHDVRSELFDANEKIEFMQASRLWKVRDGLRALQRLLSR